MYNCKWEKHVNVFLFCFLCVFFFAELEKIKNGEKGSRTKKKTIANLLVWNIFPTQRRKRFQAVEGLISSSRPNRTRNGCLVGT